MTIQKDFESIPILDYSLVKTDKKHFLDDLQYALVHVGFLYLKNSPIPKDLVDKIIHWTPKVFEIPIEEKLKVEMKNSPHFVGYSRQGNEITKNKKDNREQYDFGSDLPCAWKEGDPEYRKLWGPSQWPSEQLLPGFKQDLITYFNACTQLSYELTSLVAEALSLPADAFQRFYEKPIEKQHHRLKVVKYPAVDSLAADDGNQGVGPHCDAWFTLLLQADDLPGLQVQNRVGKWIDATPMKDTFVVNIGKGLEAVTQGVAIATTHRVLNPPAGRGPRYSVPFFQMIGHEARLGDLTFDVPQDILNLKKERGAAPVTDCRFWMPDDRPSFLAINYAEIATDKQGVATLINRIKSHPDVGQAHYPNLYNQIHPSGHSGPGSAY